MNTNVGDLSDPGLKGREGEREGERGRENMLVSECQASS